MNQEDKNAIQVDLEGIAERAFKASLMFREAEQKLKNAQPGLCLPPYKIANWVMLDELPAEAVVRDARGTIFEKPEFGVMADRNLDYPVLVLWPTGWRPDLGN